MAVLRPRGGKTVRLWLWARVVVDTGLSWGGGAVGWPLWMIDSRVGEVIISCTSTTAGGLGCGGDWCDFAVLLRGSGDVGVKVARGDPSSADVEASQEGGGQGCAG